LETLEALTTFLYFKEIFLALAAAFLKESSKESKSPKKEAHQGYQIQEAQIFHC
jgi:hypothetical protein